METWVTQVLSSQQAGITILIAVFLMGMISVVSCACNVATLGVVAGYTGTIGATGKTKAVIWSGIFFLSGTILSLTIIGGIIGYASELINDSFGNYLGVRMIRPGDTIYGWIKVTNVNYLSFTVQEFAASKNCTGIDEQTEYAKIYPVPVHNTVVVETRVPDFELTVYNQYGMEIMKKMLDSKKTQVDLSSQAYGIYVFKLNRDRSVIVKKIIKQ